MQSVTNASRSSQATQRELDNKEIALQAAVEGIVLLENDGTLPLQPGTVALFGAGAGYTITGGTGSGEVNARHNTTVFEGLTNAGFTVTTSDWIERYDRQWKDGKQAFIKETRKLLKQFSVHVLADLMAADYRYPVGDLVNEDEMRASGTDTCIYVLSRQSGEGHDRVNEPGSYQMDDMELENIRRCAKFYDRFILVLNTGAPIDLTPLDYISGINAVLYMTQLGMETGNALAEVLTGAQSPSGKLAVTWAKNYHDYPFYDEFGVYSKEPENTEYKEGIYVGYRFFDSFLVEPKYPFGYGGSYTMFSVAMNEAVLNGPSASLNVTVTNTGDHAGKEVVQLYVSCPQEGLDKEYQRLVAFAKTDILQPGQSGELSLEFPLVALSSYEEATAETTLEKGTYILRLGNSSRDTEPVAALDLPEKVVVKKHENKCRPDKPICSFVSNLCSERNETLPKGLKTLKVDPGVFHTDIYVYGNYEPNYDAATKEKLKQLTTDEQIDFLAGTGLLAHPEGFQVPGAVGHTTEKYIAKGIPNTEMCDGPAGLRVQRRSTIDKKGKIKAVDASISLYEFLPDFLKKFLLGDPEKEEVRYQFVTGFPITTAVAQTWNLELVWEIGRAVSKEMTEYGVTYWLAPAMNIIRNPLCGRNYEYYSEDPVLSGMMATAITDGVQETPGNYVTVKHYAANNQEENRYTMSSDIDERTLREIYLKGFEIVIMNSDPKAIMTAYNKINDNYCANRKDLTTDILKTEFGFDGVVMTDWLSTGDGRASEALCIESGVDIIMPGGKGVYKTLRKDFKEGRLSEAAIERAAGAVIQLCLRSERHV